MRTRSARAVSRDQRVVADIIDVVRDVDDVRSRSDGRGRSDTTDHEGDEIITRQKRYVITTKPETPGTEKKIDNLYVPKSVDKIIEERRWTEGVRDRARTGGGP